MPNEQEQFLKDLEQDNPESADIMEAPLNPEDHEEKPKGQTGATGPDGEEEEEIPDEVKNRRHKRLEARLQAERESNIAMAARLEAISEAQRARGTDDTTEYLKMVERIYGTNSPEAQEATQLLAQALQGVEERATQRALESFREQEEQRQQQLRQEEQALDSMIEQIEDQYSVTFTPEMEKGFFRQLEKLSPKDDQGNIIHYADPYAVWEDFASKQQRSVARPNPAKQLSSRSMTPSGASKESKLTDDVNERWLKENGII